MVKNHSDSEKGNPLPPHGLLFAINSKGSFMCSIPDRIAHTTAFVTPVVEHWLEREIAHWIHHERSIRPELILMISKHNDDACLSVCCLFALVVAFFVVLFLFLLLFF